jgi:hypothetical protein
VVRANVRIAFGERCFGGPRHQKATKVIRRIDT